MLVGVEGVGFVPAGEQIACGGGVHALERLRFRRSVYAVALCLGVKARKAAQAKGRVAEKEVELPPPEALARKDFLYLLFSLLLFPFAHPSGSLGSGSTTRRPSAAAPWRPGRTSPGTRARALN